MISVVYENMIIGTAIHNLPTAPCKSCCISKDYGKKVVNSNIFPSIILPQEYPTTLAGIKITLIELSAVEYIRPYGKKI